MGKFAVGQVYRYPLQGAEIKIVERSARKMTIEQDGKRKEVRIRTQDFREYSAIESDGKRFFMTAY